MGEASSLPQSTSVEVADSDTLAYSNAVIITAAKSFTEQDPGSKLTPSRENLSTIAKLLFS